jgi:hypothetical protein
MFHNNMEFNYTKCHLVEASEEKNGDKEHFIPFICTLRKCVLNAFYVKPLQEWRAHTPVPTLTH